MPSEFVFDLIKSLTPGEKRYFQKKARGGGGRTGENYLELYEILDRSPTYDEESIKNAHSNPTYSANLSFGKNYLYNQLLDALCSYHAKSGHAQLEVAAYWAKLQILLEKGLKEQAFKLIGQAKRHCKIYHLGFDHLKFLQVERNLISRIVTKGGRKKLDALIAECEELQFHLSMEMQLTTLYERYFLAHRTEKAEGRGAALAEFEAFFRKNEDYIYGKASFHSQIFFNFTLALRYEKERNYRLTRFYIGAVLELYDRDERVRTANMERYLHILYNYLTFSLLDDDANPAEFQRLFERMGKIRTDQPKLRIMLLHFGLYFKLLVALRFRQYIHAVRLDSAIADFLDQHQSTLTLDRMLSFKYHLAVAHFLTAMEDPSQKEARLTRAIHWFNDIENESKYETKSLLRSFSRVYFAMAHFDLGAEGFVSNRIRSYLIYLKNEKKTASIEFTLLSGLKKVLAGKTPEQRLKHLEAISLQLEPVSHIDELKEWVDKKVEMYRKME